MFLLHNNYIISLSLSRQYSFSPWRSEPQLETSPGGLGFHLLLLLLTVSQKSELSRGNSVWWDLRNNVRMRPAPSAKWLGLRRESVVRWRSVSHQWAPGPQGLNLAPRRPGSSARRSQWWRNSPRMLNSVCQSLSG